MAGNVPSFIAKDHYVMVDGEKKLVEDYFHTSSDSPHVPNTDKFWLKLKGEEAFPYSDREVRPIRRLESGPMPRMITRKGTGIDYQGYRGVISFYYVMQDTKGNEELIVNLKCFKDGGKGRDIEFSNMTFAPLRYEPGKFSRVGPIVQKRIDDYLEKERVRKAQERAEYEKKLAMIRKVWTPRP